MPHSTLSRAAPTPKTATPFDALALEPTSQGLRGHDLKTRPFAGLKKRGTAASIDTETRSGSMSSPCGRDLAAAENATPQASMILEAPASASLFSSLGLNMGSRQKTISKKKRATKTTGVACAQVSQTCPSPTGNEVPMPRALAREAAGAVRCTDVVGNGHLSQLSQNIRDHLMLLASITEDGCSQVHKGANVAKVMVGSNASTAAPTRDQLPTLGSSNPSTAVPTRDHLPEVVSPTRLTSPGSDGYFSGVDMWFERIPNPVVVHL